MGALADSQARLSEMELTDPVVFVFPITFRVLSSPDTDICALNFSVVRFDLFWTSRGTRAYPEYDAMLGTKRFSLISP